MGALLPYEVSKGKESLDRGVVPHIKIPLPYTWLNPSTRPSINDHHVRS